MRYCGNVEQNDEERQKINLPAPWEDWPLMHTRDYDTPSDDEQYLEELGGSLSALLGFDFYRDNVLETIGWRRIRNTQTGMSVLMLLDKDCLSGKYIIRQLICSPIAVDGVSSAELRKLPLSSIASAYQEHDLQQRIEFNLKLATNTVFGELDKPRRTLEDVTDEEAMKSLKDTPRGTHFYGLIALQYMRFCKTNPDENPAKLMAKLNESPLSSVQRWIAQARKMNLLAPAKRAK